MIYKLGGYGIEKNYTRALDYFRKAEDLGDPQSTNKLGEMYYEGLGVEKNERKAWDRFKSKWEG